MNFRIIRVWYLDFSKLSGVWNFAFQRFSKITQLLHHTRPTRMPRQRSPNLKHLHKQHSDTIWKTPQTPSPHLQSIWETNRHHQSTKDTIKLHLSGHTSSNSLFGCLGASVSVPWCLLVSVVVLNCPEITGVCFWEHNNGAYVCLWCLDAS